jgi:Tol biopolymer transport system component
LTQVSDPATTWANTLDWSLDSQTLAYNAWIDNDGDGNISTLGIFASAMTGNFGGAADISQIFLYNVASGSTTRVETADTDYAPTFVSATQVAFITLPSSAMMGGGGAGVNVYDLNAGTKSTAYQATGTVLGIAVSPDGSQVAWTESSSETDAQGNSPNQLYVAGIDFSNPRLVYTSTPEEVLGFVDAPVWTPDGTGILLSSSNILSSFMGTFASAFGGMAESFGEAAGEDVQLDTLLPKVLRVDVASGQSSVVYTGLVINPSYFAGIIAIAETAEASGSMFEPTTTP